MRLIAYALSAACGCAPVGYSYYQRAYYPPTAYAVEPYDSYTPSAWGGESALPVGYAYGYTPSYYVGAPYQSYGYEYQYIPKKRHVRIDIEARAAPATRLAAKHHGPSAKVKLAAVPTPKPRPKVAHHFPSKMVAVEEN